MRYLALLAVAALPLFSQSKGSINGDITDSSGAVIPNAKVKVHFKFTVLRVEPKEPLQARIIVQETQQSIPVNIKFQ